MLLRSLNFVIIYAISFINLSIIVTPVCFFAFLILKFVSGFPQNDLMEILRQFWVCCIFFISFYCSIYIVLDFIFGFTIYYYSKGCRSAARSKEYDDINEIFLSVCKRFDNTKTDLYISSSEDINAYAIGGLRKSRVVITQGLINHLFELSVDKKDFRVSIAGIIGHEMSHIVNMDFLPGVFLHSIGNAVNLINKIVNGLLYFFTAGLGFIPIIGWVLKFVIKTLHKVIHFLFHTILYSGVILSFSSFLTKFLSRGIEYRSDMDSAKAVGGEMIYAGLDKISSKRDSVWRSIFSTHPKTSFRMSKVKDVEMKDEVIRPSIFTDFVNLWILLMLFFVTAVLGYECKAHKIPYYTISFYKMSEAKFYEIQKKVYSYMSSAEKLYSAYQSFSSLIGRGSNKSGGLNASDLLQNEEIQKKAGELMEGQDMGGLLGGNKELQGQIKQLKNAQSANNKEIEKQMKEINSL